MLFLVFLLTASYFAFVLRVLKSKQRLVVVAAPCLPEEDRAPVAAVGLPPEGVRFAEYVDDGFASLDAYLCEVTPPEIS
jgi:hypothetical protein